MPSNYQGKNRLNNIQGCKSTKFKSLLWTSFHHKKQHDKLVANPIPLLKCNILQTCRTYIMVRVLNYHKLILNSLWGKCYLIEREWTLFGRKLSLVGVHYHFGLASVPVFPSRPSKDGFARLDGHMRKLDFCPSFCPYFCYKKPSFAHFFYKNEPVWRIGNTAVHYVKSTKYYLHVSLLNIVSIFSGTVFCVLVHIQSVGELFGLSR